MPSTLDAEVLAMAIHEVTVTENDFIGFLWRETSPEYREHAIRQTRRFLERYDALISVHRPSTS